MVENLTVMSTCEHNIDWNLINIYTTIMCVTQRCINSLRPPTKRSNTITMYCISIYLCSQCTPVYLSHPLILPIYCTQPRNKQYSHCTCLYTCEPTVVLCALAPLLTPTPDITNTVTVHVYIPVSQQ